MKYVYKKLTRSEFNRLSDEDKAIHTTERLRLKSRNGYYRRREKILAYQRQKRATETPEERNHRIEVNRLNKEKNSDRIKQYSKDYYQKNKDKIKARVKEWVGENRGKVNARMRAYSKKRKAIDVQYRLSCSLRQRLCAAMRAQIDNPQRDVKGKTLELLGCSLKELMSHLEARFTKGMSWDNYGEWHIDHILPCNSFDLTEQEEQELCFHYTNMQPLWASDNIRKGDRICA